MIAQNTEAVIDAVICNPYKCAPSMSIGNVTN